MVTLRMPKLFDLRADPFERTDHQAIGYAKWRVEHAYVFGPAQNYVGKHLSTYTEFPPRQKAGTFGLEDVLKKLESGSSSQ